ncbi:MAG: methylenetetrahydrofolate reductase, partial [Thermodesulfobacteriota bacterium]
MKSGSNLEQVLRQGHFAVTGELGPPKNADPEVVRKKARILAGAVDAANITDCQTAIVRISSIGAGLLAQAEGVEPVIQMTCRDRNRIGMQSDILGASALGLKNLLCLTGDHQRFGNHPGAKGVFDMDSIQMLSMVKGMRDDRRFQCGEEIKGPVPELFLGCAANPFAGPFEFRAARLGKKITAGADFVQTQIIYNVEKFRRFMEMARELGLPEKAFILAGVTPPKSVGMAKYMKTSVPGLDVPDEIIQRMTGAKDKQEEGINICVDIISEVRQIKGVAGVHIMAIEWESAVPEIAKRAGLLPRPVLAAVAPVQPAAPAVETITVAAAAPAAPVAAGEAEALMARARAEAEAIVAAAHSEAARIRTATMAAAVPEAAPAEKPPVSQETGEEEMNERERQLALESIRLGLDSLKRSLGLSEDQFESVKRFLEAQTILS